MLLNGGKLAGSMQMDRRFMVMETNCPQRVVCPCPGAIYMYTEKKVIRGHLIFFLLVQKVNYDQLKFMIKLINQCLTVALRVSAFQNAWYVSRSRSMSKGTLFSKITLYYHQIKCHIMTLCFTF